MKITENEIVSGVSNKQMEKGIKKADKQADFQSVITQRIEYLEEKIKNGDTETSYRIGASSFTEREWNKLMANVDEIQDDMRRLMREEHEKREKESKEKEKNVN